jgi:hypothetical protein
MERDSIDDVEYRCRHGWRKNESRCCFETFRAGDAPAKTSNAPLAGPAARLTCLLLVALSLQQLSLLVLPHFLAALLDDTSHENYLSIRLALLVSSPSE